MHSRRSSNRRSTELKRAPDIGTARVANADSEAILIRAESALFLLWPQRRGWWDPVICRVRNSPCTTGYRHSNVLSQPPSNPMHCREFRNKHVSFVDDLL